MRIADIYIHYVPKHSHKDGNGRITLLESDDFYEGFCFHWAGKGNPPSEESEEFKRYCEGLKKIEEVLIAARKHRNDARLPYDRLDMVIGTTA